MALVGEDDVRERPRFTIGGPMLLVAAVAGLTWVVKWSEGGGFLLKHWRFVALAILPLYGLVWSVLRVYRVRSDRQALSIVGLIASLLGILGVPFVYGWWIGGFE